MRRLSSYLAGVLAVVAIVSVASGQGVLNSLEREISALVEGIRPSLVTVEASDRESHHQSWVGSGVAWSADGKIVTTASLISDEDEVTVVLADGRRIPAKVLGIDDQYNLALLQAEGAGLQAVKLGNSDNVKPGSWVTVIGNSYGLASSVNFGLINGVREKDSLLQLSASVAPGNAGGPVLNTRGEMIGLVYGRLSEQLNLGPLSIFGEDKRKSIAVFSHPLEMPTSETALAIPANKIQAVCQDLEKFGTRKKGFLGVTIDGLSEGERKELKISSGIKVKAVVDESPAEKAGVKDDDVIVEFNGKRVSGTDEFRRAVAELKPGTKVKVRIKRSGKDVSISAELAEAPGRSHKLRLNKLRLPDLDIDLPDIDLQHIDRPDASEMRELRRELEKVKEELGRIKEKLGDQMIKMKRDAKKAEKEGGM